MGQYGPVNPFCPGGGGGGEFHYAPGVGQNGFFFCKNQFEFLWNLHVESHKLSLI